jgi:hypothetical protein
MSFNLSLVSFFVLIIAYFIVVEIFTVLFRLTGLREDKARFQAVSCMTNSGFTTRESELILNSAARRNLARVMMLFGYLFAVSGVSLLVNLFFRSSGDQIKKGTFCNNVRVLEMFHDKLIAEVFVTCIPPEIRGKTLLEMNFRHTYKLNILLIKRGNTIMDHVIASDEIKQGDRVLIYGSKINIMDLFKDSIE